MSSAKSYPRMGTQLRWIDAHPAPVDRLAPTQQERFRQYLGEILSPLGLDLYTDGTRDTPARLLAHSRDHAQRLPERRWM
jgi:hypothetical protein